MTNRQHGTTAANNWRAVGFFHSPDATLILANRVILQASKMVEATFGWSPAELEGQSMRILYPGEAEYEMIGQRAHAAMLVQEVYRDERFMRLKDGSIVWMEGYGRALDQSDPEQMTVWTYRRAASAISTVGLLTPTEKKVAHYIVNGFTSKEIALTMGISHRTVEVHRSNMMKKLNTRNSSDLARCLISAQA